MWIYITVTQILETAYQNLPQSQPHDTYDSQDLAEARNTLAGSWLSLNYTSGQT